ncbi:hypothetical protein ACFSSA_01270 [Luteolibacter algae]|uniref:Outer membrane beta-barrel protein n=1 Tax=Luteolibacter algae TaxID=454151 RepID=A0ABW5D2L4_9BACT
MKTKTALSLITALTASMAYGKGLYYVPNDTEESVPISWSVGVNAIWDDNTTPGGATDGDETFSLNPYVGLSFVSVTPQTTWDVYARLGVIYYLDEPSAAGSDDTYGQARVGVNLTHRFNERLRLTSRNFLSYELEPDYSYGFATTRQLGEYLYWQTDNALGYRWTERFATYTGFELTGLDYDNVANQDRFTWTLYNQFRYQLSPQTVATATYRYSQTDADGLAQDSNDQFLLVGLEHRFSPSTILVANAGAQIRDVDGGDNSTNPYLELTLRSQINQQFSVRGFVRYGAEVYDTVQSVPGLPFFDSGLAEFDSRLTLRVGVSGEYQISPSLSIFGGVDVINTSYEDGRGVISGAQTGDKDETLVNAYVGASLKLTEYLYGTLSYNFTNSDSDLVNRDYDRNRVNLGLRAEF